MKLTFVGSLATLAAALVAGCGGDTLSLDPVAEAASKTEAAKSMRLEMTMTMTAPGAEPMTITAKGAVDGTRSSMSMSMPAVEGVALGDVEVRSELPLVYMRMPFLQELAPTLKPWIKLDLDEVGKEAGIDLESIMQFSQQSDPTQSLDYLRAAGEVEEIGSATVRGVETTQYRAEIDLERYLEQVGEESSQQAADAFRKVIELAGMKTMSMNLWVDADSLVRRMTWTQHVAVEPGAEPTATSISMDLFDFGTEVDVVLPPDDQTSSLAELQQLAESG